jgi:hypothetical protein
VNIFARAGSSSQSAHPTKLYLYSHTIEQAELVLSMLFRCRRRNRVELRPGMKAQADRAQEKIASCRDHQVAPRFS